MMLQSLDAVVAQNEPELQGAEPPAEAYLPVPVVDYRAGLGRLVAEVFRKNRKGFDQRRPVGEEEGREVQIGEQPLVGIHDVAVGELDPVVEPPHLGQHGGRSRQCCVDMEPSSILPGDLADSLHRIDRG